MYHEKLKCKSTVCTVLAKIFFQAPDLFFVQKQKGLHHLLKMIIFYFNFKRVTHVTIQGRVECI